MGLICTKYRRYQRFFLELKILGVSAIFLGGQHIGVIGDIFGRLTVQPWASNARVKKKIHPVAQLDTLRQRSSTTCRMQSTPKIDRQNSNFIRKKKSNR